MWVIQYVWCVSVILQWNFSTLVSCTNGMNVLNFFVASLWVAHDLVAFFPGQEHHTAFQWWYFPQASLSVPYAGHKDLRMRSWRFPQFHLISCNCLLVASWVLSIFIALWSVKVSSCSRSFVCACGLFDPKIKASVMLVRVFVLNSFTEMQTFLRKESTVFAWLLLYCAKFVTG